MTRLRESKPNYGSRRVRPAAALQHVLQQSSGEIAGLLRHENGRTTLVSLAGESHWLQPAHIQWLEKLALFALRRRSALYTNNLGRGVDEPTPAGIQAAWFMPLDEKVESGSVLVVLNAPAAFHPEVLTPALLEDLGTVGDQLQLRLRAPRAAGPPDAALLEVARRERKRLSYELHDGPARRILECIHYLDRCETTTHDPQLVDGFTAARTSLRAALEEMRRLVMRYRDDSPYEDLQTALLSVVEEAQQTYRSEIEIDAPVDDRRLTTLQRSLLVSAVRELLFNAWRHGKSSVISVLVKPYEDTVALTVRDNGVGFDASHWRDNARRGHYGLIGLSERAEACAGTVEVESSPGQGTSVVIRFLVKRDQEPGTRDSGAQSKEGDV